MSWLAIFILVCNPPFSDFADPEIELDELSYLKTYDQPSDWKILNYTEGITPRMEAPVKIKISAKIIDNTDIDKDSVKITINPSNNPSIFPNSNRVEFEMDNIKGSNYEIVFESTNATSGFNHDTYTFTIEAKDNHGHKRTFSNKFEIRS